MRYLAEESLMKRMQSTWLERLRYQCPPRLAEQAVPVTLKSHLNKNCFILVTKFANSEVSSFSKKILLIKFCDIILSTILNYFLMVIILWILFIAKHAKSLNNKMITGYYLPALTIIDNKVQSLWSGSLMDMQINKYCYVSSI